MPEEKTFGAHKQSDGNTIFDNNLSLIKHKSLTMNTLWYLKQFVLLMSALWIPSSIYIIRDQHKAIANINKVLQIPKTQNQLVAVNATSNENLSKSNLLWIAHEKMKRRTSRDLNARYAITKRLNTRLSKELQLTKNSLEQMIFHTSKTSALQMEQGKTMIQRLRRNVMSKYTIVKGKAERSKKDLAYALAKINSLTDQVEVKTNLLWLAVGLCALFIILPIKMFATKARIKSEDLEKDKIAGSTNSGGRKGKILVETVNQGTDYVIFTFTRNTERFLKTPRCAMMTQLKQLPCFAEKLVQEIYIPDNPELGPLETSLGNVKGCICVYEYNDRDIILEVPTDLETKKRDTLALLIKTNDASGLKLLVVYMFDPRSAKLWDGEIYNTLIGQTYGNDVLKGVANAGQFISINKEFIKLQLDQIQTILQ